MDAMTLTILIVVAVVAIVVIALLVQRSRRRGGIKVVSSNAADAGMPQEGER